MNTLNKIRNRVGTAAVWLAAFLLLSPAAAEESDTPWYEVEVIIFAQKDPAIDSEHWPEEPGIADTLSAVELLPPRQPRPEWRDETGAQEDGGTPAPVPFQRLAKQEYGLNEIAARLENSERQELLLHVGWRQPGYTDDDVVAVHVHEGLSGDYVGAVGDAGLPEATDADSDPTSTAMVSGDPAGTGDTDFAVGADSTYGMPIPPRLDGTLRLTLSRYLHIDADLVYRLPLEMPFDDLVTSIVPDGNGSANAAPGEQVQSFRWFQPYRMREQRRMRSGELHYMDHPILGIVARVQPYEPPKPPEPAETAAMEETQSGDGVTAAPLELRGGRIER